MFDPTDLMRLAIEKCRTGIQAGQSPFACAIARGNEVLAVSHNTVLANSDITAHAEINALREACRATGDIHLETAVVACTCEPCPMCLAALHWARVQEVYFGAGISDAHEAGFNELCVPAAKLLSIGGSHVNLMPSVLADECRQLFEMWRARPDARTY